MSAGRVVGAARSALLAGVTAGAGLMLAACDGSTSKGVSRISAGPLIVYTGLPLIGPSRSSGLATLDGARMALAAVHGRIGRYTITLHALDDATVSSHGWDPGQTTANAGLVAKDPRSIGYVGDLNSGASAVSLPVLNRADIPQISPLSTAVGLTDSGPEASPGEPQKYYPTMTRTFARVIPNDIVQSAVQVALQRQAGCRRIYVLYDDEVDGRDAATSFQVAAKAAGLNVLGFDQFDSTAKNYVSLGRKLVKLDPDCLLISALTQNHAAAVTDTVGAALPSARLFVTASLAETDFVSPAHGGVSASLDPRLTITAATLDAADYPPAGRRFLTDFARRYGPGRLDGIWGYEAMALMLDSIRRASADGSRDLTRTEVLRALLSTHNRTSVLGTYSIDSSGDSTLRRYGVYHVVDGQMVFWKAMRG